MCATYGHRAFINAITERCTRSNCSSVNDRPKWIIITSSFGSCGPSVLPNPAILKMDLWNKTNKTQNKYNRANNSQNTQNNKPGSFVLFFCCHTYFRLNSPINRFQTVFKFGLYPAHRKSDICHLPRYTQYDIP